MAQNGFARMRHCTSRKSESMEMRYDRMYFISSTLINRDAGHRKGVCLLRIKKATKMIAYGKTCPMPNSAWYGWCFHSLDFWPSRIRHHTSKVDIFKVAPFNGTCRVEICASNSVHNKIMYYCRFLEQVSALNRVEYLLLETISFFIKRWWKLYLILLK